MPMPMPVTLQVSLAPTDLRTARHVVPHQLRQWAAQVDEILFTVDLHRSPSSPVEPWRRQLPGLRRLIEEWCAMYPHARWAEVDYRPGTMTEIAAAFFGGQPVPAKDYRGAAFYAYFYGLFAARHDHVLHTDSDMLYGGGSPQWLAEALTLLDECPKVLACNPLPGPPTRDGTLRSQALQPFPYRSPAFQAAHLSTRVFLLNRNHFRQRVGALRLGPPRRYDAVRALIDGNPPNRSPEAIVTQAMVRRGLIRIDFLGEVPGMWAIHPPYRSERFYQRLPSLVQEIEAGEVPEAQRGCHDINDSLVDWTGAQRSLAKRVGYHVALAARRLRPAGKGSAPESGSNSVAEAVR
jgi:hypothetical protein